MTGGDAPSGQHGMPAAGTHGGDGAAVAAALGIDPADMLDLSASMNPVAPDPLPIVVRYLREGLDGYPDARRAEAALAEAMGVDRKRLLLTNGGAEAISLVAAEIGGRVREPEFALHPRSGGPLWRSNPHSPSGLLAPADERVDVWDEAFYPLATGAWTRGDADAVVVGSLTKLLATPGLRVGYVLADPELVSACRARQPHWAVNGLACAALPDLLASVDLAATERGVAELRGELVDLLALNGITARPSDANWVLVEYAGLREALAPLGVLVRDCASFGMPGFARIAVPTADGLAKLARALARLRDPASTDRPGRSRRAMTPSPFDAASAAVRPIDTEGAGASADERTGRLTKPAGALGLLEPLGARLAAIARACPPPVPTSPTVCVFAADHGVVTQGVTPWPQEVTAQMVANLCAGGAAVNVFARQVGARVLVVDVGVATTIPGDSPLLLRRCVRPGTADLSAGPAMTDEQARAALDVGADIAGEAVAGGSDLLVTGEMGIGNTTAAAAVIAAITRLPATEVTGRGTGIDDAVLARKIGVIDSAVARLDPDADPLTVLGEVGGLEIAAMAGLLIGGAAAGVPVIIDGVIAASAALVACALVPHARGYVIAGHRSVEPGATAALQHLALGPLLDLGMRLGEGTGATLAIPLVQSAARILNEMATFDEAEVSEA